jgi:hypothetical protein
MDEEQGRIDSPTQDQEEQQAAVEQHRELMSRKRRYQAAEYGEVVDHHATNMVSRPPTRKAANPYANELEQMRQGDENVSLVANKRSR